jgi:hypothetical protein
VVAPPITSQQASRDSVCPIRFPAGCSPNEDRGAPVVEGHRPLPSAVVSVLEKS